MKLKNILIILMILNIPLLLLLGSARLNVFNINFYEEEFSKYKPDVQDAAQIAAETLTFLLADDASVDSIAAFKEEEQTHLIEVKSVMHTAVLWLYTSLMFFILGSIALFFLDKKSFKGNMGRVSFYGGIFSASGLVILALLSLFNFNVVFTRFHEIFFTTVWQFPPDYLLIQLFPAEFFMDITIKIFTGSLMGSAFLIFVGYLAYFSKKNRKLLKSKKNTKKRK